MAISKQQKAKNEQGYIAKPIPKSCSRCEHFLMDTEKVKSYFVDFTKESNLRCAIGGFAVKKTATCDEFKRKEEE